MTTAASVSKRSRRCENGYRSVARSLVAPNSGMVSKIRGNTGITFVPGNVGWPRGGQRNRGEGAPTRAATGPSERPHGDGDPGGPPSRPGRFRTTRRLKQNRKRPHLSRNFISRPKFVSRSKYRLAPVRHIR